MKSIANIFIPKRKQVLEKGEYFHGLARVKCADGSYNYVTQKNRFLFPKGFYEAEEFIYACAIADGTLYDAAGKVAVKGKAKPIKGTSDYVIIYDSFIESRGALVTHDGIVLTPHLYSSISYSSERFYANYKREQESFHHKITTESWFCFLDKDGKEISFRYATMPSSPERVRIDEKLSLVSIYPVREAYSNFCTCLVNRETNEILLKNCTYVEGVSHVIFGEWIFRPKPYIDTLEDDWEEKVLLKGVWRKDGGVIIPAVFKSIKYDANQGYYIVESSSSLFGLYDSDGHLLVEPKYEKLIIPDSGNTVFVEAKHLGVGIAVPDSNFDVYRIASNEYKRLRTNLFDFKKRYVIHCTKKGRLFFSIFQDPETLQEGIMDEYRHILLSAQFDAIRIQDEDVVIASCGEETSRFFIDELYKQWANGNNQRLDFSGYSLDLTRAELDNRKNFCFIDHAQNLLFFDTETSGLPKEYNAPVSDIDNWPRLLQLSWIITDSAGNISEEGNYLIKPEGFIYHKPIASPFNVTEEELNSQGLPLLEVLKSFSNAIDKVDIIIGHNVSFDINVLRAELTRRQLDDCFGDKPYFDTMIASKEFFAQPNQYGFKYPKLEELYMKLFKDSMQGAHDALFDVMATKQCFFELRNIGVIK